MIKKTEQGFALVLSLVLLLAMSLMGGAIIILAVFIQFYSLLVKEKKI